MLDGWPCHKKHRNLDAIFDVRGCGFFDFSKIAMFGGLTRVSYTVVLRSFSIVATRIFFDEANDGLWPNYILNNFFDFSSILLMCKKPWKIYQNRTENANLLRIPRSAAPGQRPTSISSWGAIASDLGWNFRRLQWRDWSPHPTLHTDGMVEALLFPPQDGFHRGVFHGGSIVLWYDDYKSLQ